MDNNKKLKVSWTILSAWSAKRYDDVLDYIQGKGIEDNVYLRRGRDIHDTIASGKLKLLPFIKNTAIFEDIRPKEKVWTNFYRVEVFPWLDVSMVADVIDPVEGLVIDWKTAEESSTRQNKLQVYLYAYLLALEGIEIKHGVIATVGDDEQGLIRLKDFCMYKIDKEKLDIAENYIESNASEIYNFLEERKLI